MFDNVALNVVIGLVFIYLLYSLFATVLSEIIATQLGLRARNLKEAIDRMLNDEKEGHKPFLLRLLDSMRLMKNPRNPRITNFYNHSEIKYLGSTGIFKVPSQFKAISFSKTVVNLLNETGYNKLQLDKTTKMRDPDEGDRKDIPATVVTRERIDAALLGIVHDHRTETDRVEKLKIVLDEETAKYVLSLWEDSFGDLTKFRLQLEAWFDRTMEQCLEWYKRKIRVVLLILGFMLAWFFNADTFIIINKLSNDKDAREKLVTLAAAYSERNKTAPPEPGTTPLTNAQIDSLLGIKQKLSQDISDANTVLGTGCWPADSVRVRRDSASGVFFYEPSLDRDVMAVLTNNTIPDGGYYYFEAVDKWRYFGWLLRFHFLGYLVTAIAISLGAPFWFDLLNKLMSLRTSVKQGTNSTADDSGTGVSQLKRVG
jgi:hypothetical protein